MRMRISECKQTLILDVHAAVFAILNVVINEDNEYY